jgi:glycosyltransferase involved in cell wall biosynthesis
MVATLVERMDRELVRSEVVTLAAPGPVAEQLRRSGVSVRSLGDGGLAMAFIRLGRVLRAERYHVVNAYGFKASVVVRFLVRALGRGALFVSGVRCLHVTESERVDAPKARFALAVERLLSPLVHIYDANSVGALDLLHERGIDRKRLHYIPNGIDVAQWPARPEGEDAGRVPTVLCVARFVPRKRQRDLVAAVARLRSEGIALRVVLAGAGPTLPEVRQYASELGVSELVSFSGRIDRAGVRRMLADADVFCLVSLSEGMAGTVMEAMASGLPVVGTRVNGIAELVDDGRTGILVPPERPDLLADALAELLVDASKRRTLGREGRAKIVRQFGIDRMVAAKQELYLAGLRGGETRRERPHRNGGPSL